MTGKLIAIAATDAEFYDMAPLTCFIFVCPLVFILGGILLYLYIGPASLIALGIMIIYLCVLRFNVRFMK